MGDWFVPSVIVLFLVALVFGILWGVGVGASPSSTHSLRYKMPTELLPRTEKAKYRVWVQLIGDSYLNLTPEDERLGIDPAASHFSAPVLRYGADADGEGGDTPLFGTTATDGFKELAELGTTATFVAEATTSGKQTVVFEASSGVTRDYETVIELDAPGDGESATIEIFTMLAPSPDWVAYGGSSVLSVAADATWRNFTVLPILLVDAGTDAGTTATSPDNPQTTRTPINLVGISVPFVGFIHMVRVSE